MFSHMPEMQMQSQSPYRLSIDKSDIAPAQGISPDQVLLMAALSARWENADAIDTAITSAVEDPNGKQQFSIGRLLPFSPVSKRTTAYCTHADGTSFITTKGAPQVPFRYKVTARISALREFCHYWSQPFATALLPPCPI